MSSEAQKHEFHDNDETMTLKCLQANRVASRLASIPSCLEDARVFMRLLQSWTKYNIENHTSMKFERKKPSLQQPTVAHVAQLLCDFFFVKQNTLNLNILEVGCGRGDISHIIFATLKQKMTSLKWIATDAIDQWSSLPLPLELQFQLEEVHALEAVRRYGDFCNVLVLVCPLPHAFFKMDKTNQIWCYNKPAPTFCGYSDYYSIRMFIEQFQSKEHANDKFIVFIGELGLEHGSRGMFKHLMSHPSLKMLLRKTIDKQPSAYCQAYNIKIELIIWKIVRLPSALPQN